MVLQNCPVVSKGTLPKITMLQWLADGTIDVLKLF
jgi:hypothetical protein